MLDLEAQAEIFEGIQELNEEISSINDLSAEEQAEYDLWVESLGAL